MARVIAVLQTKTSWFETDVTRQTESGNPHWVPQTRFCGGLATTLGQYQFAREFRKETFRADVKELLLRLEERGTLPKEETEASTQDKRTHKHADELNPKYILNVNQSRRHILDYYVRRPLGPHASTNRKEDQANGAIGPVSLKALASLYATDYSVFGMTPRPMSHEAF